MSVMYHRCSYPRLVQIICCNPDFKFDNKSLVVSEVGYFLRLQRSRKNMFGPQDIRSLKDWVSLLKRKEEIRVVEAESLSTFYLQAQSKVATLLLYLVLMQHSEKVYLEDPRQHKKWNKQDQSPLVTEVPVIEA